MVDSVFELTNPLREYIFDTKIDTENPKKMSKSVVLVRLMLV